MHRKWWRTSILLPGHGVQNLQLSAHVTAGIDPKDWSFFKMPPLQNASVISRTSLWLQKLLHEAHSSTIYFRPTSLPPQKKKNKSGPLRTSAEILGAVLEVEASQPPEAPRLKRLMVARKLLQLWCQNNKSSLFCLWFWLVQGDGYKFYGYKHKLWYHVVYIYIYL